MMMKSINDSNNNSNNNISNWLGFSLSHNNKMEVTNANASSFSNSSVPTSFFPDSDVNFSSGFHPTSHLNVIMPIKSDVPLCIMEALTKSQSQVPASSSPKLENFLGGETEALPLSLNSIYYQQINAAEQEQQHFYPFYYSNGEQPRESTSFLTGFSADQISPMPNWVARSYTTQQVIEHQHMGNADFTAATDQISPTEVNCLAMETKKRGPGIVGPKKIVHRKSIDTFGQRTSQYRGVTKHRWTGRYEAHLWDNSCKKEGQTRKGRQVYLGGYDMEEKAARAYDLAALKYWGPSTHINFPLENYKDGLEEMKNMTRQEFVAHLRRRSSGFSRGASMYRGVTRHHQHGRWQARIGRVAGNKDLYLGTFSTQEEAAEAYDIAAIKFRGTNAVTNFDITRYDVDKIISSNTLLAGDQAKRFKAIDPCPASQQINVESNYSSCDWKMSSNAFPQQQQQQQQQQRALGNHKQEDIIGVGNYQGSNFLQDLIGTNSLSSATGHDQSELNKIGSIQLSNASSIVTSLNSSREGSPAEKSGSSTSNVVLFPKAPVSWISPASAHFPVFAAWGDA